MVVYWDLAALVNGAADYLLLLSAARLAGRTVPRLRLLGAAAFGAAYAKTAHWKLYLLSSHTEFERTFGRPADKKRKLYNGTLRCDLFQYTKDV